MRSALVLSALAAFVAASPLAAPAPQDLDFDAIDAAGAVPIITPSIGATAVAPTYNPSAAVASASVDAATAPASSATGSPSRRRNLNNFEARQNAACSKQPPGSAPPAVPDTVAGFYGMAAYAEIASDAPIPQGYTQVFGGLQGSMYQGGFMGLYTLTSYDTIGCQQQCDAAAGCVAFNIYIERDPSLAPGPNCIDPSSTINYKCTLYGLPISAATATNMGQPREMFQVVITGSNGYSKNAAPSSLPNFVGPTEFGGAINAPSGYIGMKYYPGIYNPAQCAAACQTTTAYDMKHAPASGKYDACNFFNSYVLSINNAPQGTYCSLYTTPWGRSYATNFGQYRNGNYYSNSQSYGYTLSPLDPGQI